jgi:hypothetical protein
MRVDINNVGLKIEELALTTIAFVGEDLWMTFGFFNSNAYPVLVRPQLDASARQAAMFRYQVKSIDRDILEDGKYFYNQLLDGKAALIQAVKTKPELDWVACCEDTSYLSSLNSVFYSLKSFLDVYAQLMVSLIEPSQRMTFKRANVGGETLSGGTFIKWLVHSCPSDFTNARKLSNAIAMSSRSWITEAVLKYRDRLAHNGTINGLTSMHVVLADFVMDFHDSRIKAPSMPDGTEVNTYCISLLNNLGDFVDETLKLLPNVDLNLVHRGDFSRVTP